MSRTIENLHIQETFVNETAGYRFGETEPYEPFTDDLGKLFRNLQAEYGRCTGKVYTDSKDGVKAIGWVFEKRMKYEDARTNKPEDYYLCSVWVTLHTPTGRDSTRRVTFAYVSL